MAESAKPSGELGTREHLAHAPVVTVPTFLALHLQPQSEPAVHVLPSGCRDLSMPSRTLGVDHANTRDRLVFLSEISVLYFDILCISPLAPFRSFPDENMQFFLFTHNLTFYTCSQPLWSGTFFQSPSPDQSPQLGAFPEPVSKKDASSSSRRVLMSPYLRSPRGHRRAT